MLPVGALVQLKADDPDSIGLLLEHIGPKIIQVVVYPSITPVDVEYDVLEFKSLPQLSASQHRWRRDVVARHFPVLGNKLKGQYVIVTSGTISTPAVIYYVQYNGDIIVASGIEHLYRRRPAEVEIVPRDDNRLAEAQQLLKLIRVHYRLL